MTRTILLFTFSAVLSIATFYFKSEHSLDIYLVIPVGLYFIIAYFLSFQPKVETSEKLRFAGLALLVWLVLFAISYNLLFFIIAPLAGGLGAWLIFLLSKKYLGMHLKKPWHIILTGVGASLLGIGFMILVKQSASIGIKAGVLTGLWQVGVGRMIAKRIYSPVEIDDEDDEDD